jgi:glycosyltransferase involved in cell wall biosynthesis
MSKEKSIAFVVPVYKEAGLYLPRCLHSLLENQDYPHKKIVVVYDGKGDGIQMKTALKQAKIFKNDNRVEFIYHKKNKGAPAARNKGLKFVKEKWPDTDYVCFFDCDSMLRAGGIRTWIKTFEENPDVGFVYGGYRYTMRDQYQTGIPAQEFDPWLLTCNNYISSMNPIKLEVCPEWDEELSSLQDWDLFLTLTEKGIKGKKINEFVVITEPPTGNSISGKSHKNWIDIYKEVREKHGITGRDVAVTSMGAMFQSKRRAKFLGADYRDPQMLYVKPHEYKAVVSMGYYVDSTSHPYSVFINDNPDCKKIIYFIGTDVLQLQCKKFLEVREFRNTTCKNVDHIFCNAPWLQKELEEMGIESELLYCPIDAKKYKLSNLPKKYTIAVYRSDSNPVHNEPFIFDVARSCPDINFKFFGGTPLKALDMPKNIEYVGTIADEDMPAFIETTSAILRITLHDGFPATLAEWALSGRPFICNLPEMPLGRFLPVTPTDVTYIKDKEDTIKAIRELQKDLEDSDVKDQEAMRAYYTDLLNPETFIKRMNEVVND